MGRVALALVALASPTACRGPAPPASAPDASVETTSAIVTIPVPMLSPAAPTVLVNPPPTPPPQVTVIVTPSLPGGVATPPAAYTPPFSQSGPQSGATGSAAEAGFTGIGGGAGVMTPADGG